MTTINQPARLPAAGPDYQDYHTAHLSIEDEFGGEVVVSFHRWKDVLHAGKMRVRAVWHYHDTADDKHICLSSVTSYPAVRFATIEQSLHTVVTQLYRKVEAYHINAHYHAVEEADPAMWLNMASER